MSARPAPLTDFPRPSIAVDIALFTLLPTQPQSWRLAVVLVRSQAPGHEGEWALPGRFVHERQRLSEAVREALRDKVGVAGLQPTQLAVFDEPDRDERGWVLSVAHLDSIPWERLQRPLERRRAAVYAAPITGSATRSQVRLAVPEGSLRLRDLPFDHGEILWDAITELRRRYEAAPDPVKFLGDREFTMSELRQVHEAVLGRAWQRDTFRRAMEGRLEPQGTKPLPSRGRPAQWYRRSRG